MQKDIAPFLKRINPRLLATYHDYLSWEKRLARASVERHMASIRSFCLFKPNSSIQSPQLQDILKTPSSSRRILEQSWLQSKYLRLVYMLYQRYHQLPLVPALHFGLLVLAASLISIGVYNHWFNRLDHASIAGVQTPIQPDRLLTFSGKLTHEPDIPVTTNPKVVLRIYDHPDDSSYLYTTGSCTIKTDQDGTFTTIMGKTCGQPIPGSVFAHPSLYLGVTLEGEKEMTPRHALPNVAYALKSDSLGGFSPSSQAKEKEIPVIDDQGRLVLAATSPELYASSGKFTLRGQGLTLATDTGSGGNINLSPDSGGVVNLVFAGNEGNQINATAANLDSGSLYYGAVPSDNSNHYLIRLQGGSKLSDRFRVDALGQVLAGERLTLAGISPTIAATDNQNLRLGDYATARVIIQPELLVEHSILAKDESIDLGSADRPWHTLYINNIGAARGNLNLSGNVGIGTASPGYKLEVAGGTVAGAGAYVNTSSRTYKQNFGSISPEEVLEKIHNLEIQTWEFKPEHTTDDPYRHLSPFSEDFFQAFGLGKNDKVITSLDVAGVALAGIQGLSYKLGRLEDKVSRNLMLTSHVLADLAQTGFLDVDKLISQTVNTVQLAAESITANTISTGVIRPIPDNDLVIDLSQASTNNSQNLSQARKLTLRGKGEQEVASIDAQGNIKAQGTITGQNLTINGQATISGTLNANEVVTSQGSLNDIVARLQDRFAQATESAQFIASLEKNNDDVHHLEASFSSLMAGVGSWSSSPEASPGGQLTLDREVVATDGLTVLGRTSLSETYIHGPLLATGISIDNGAIDSFSKALEFQKSAAFAIEMMAGLVAIDVNGNLTVSGSITVRGGLRTDRIDPLTPDADVAITNLKTKVISTNRLALSTESEASASALTVSQVASISGILAPGVQSQAASGTAILPAQAQELVVFNSAITSDSLVYVTPQSQTGNNVLYVAAKHAQSQSAQAQAIGSKQVFDKPAGEPGYFRVAIDKAYDKDIVFTWLVVDGQH